MATTRQAGPPIYPGYPWRLTIDAGATALFPSGITIAAQFRLTVDSATVLATISTADGSIVRVSDTQINLILPDTATDDFEVGTVFVDLVRTDLAPDEHMGIRLQVPVVQPVTRGLA